MSNKEIKFSARLDDTQLAQDIAAFQKKLKDLQEESNRAAQGLKLNSNLANNGLPAMGNYTQQAYQTAYNNNNNATRNAFAAEVEQLKKLESVRESLTKKLERQTKIQETMKEQGLDLLKIEERRAATAEKLAAANKDVNSKLSVLTSGTSLLRPDLKPGEQYGPPAPEQGPGGFQKMVSALGGPAAIIAGIATAVRTGNAVYRGMGEAPINTVSGFGSAIAGTTGREINAIYSGRSGVENAYLSEKAQASAMASETLRRKENTGLSDILSGIVGATAVGAGAGSLVPAIGTGIGAATGFLGSTAYALSNKSNLYTLGSALGIKSAERARQAELAQGYAEDYNKAFSGMKEMNPLKKEAVEQYTGNSDRYLQFQRQLGLDYGSFHGEGGFRNRATSAGYTDDMAMGMTGQIFQAGGSTGSSGSQSALTGLNAQRNFNLSNAGSLLGRLGSVSSNPAESKEALVRILAEGTKLGFDGSHYAEESRKFSESVTEIISRTGSSSVDDASRAARNFAGFVNDPTTTAGLQGAKGGYDAFQEISSATSGAKGVMRAAGLNSIAGLSQETRINLADLKDEELTDVDPNITRGAREAKMTVPDFIAKLQENNRKAITRRPVQGIADRLNAFQTKNNISIGLNNLKDMPDNIREDYENLYGGIKVDQKSGISAQALSSLTSRYIGGGRAPGKSTEDVRNQLDGTGKTGRVEDESVRAAAESSDFILKNFRAMKDEIVPSAEAIHRFNAGLSEFVQIVNKMPQNIQAQVYAKMNTATVSGNAPQGGTPTPGGTK